MNDQCSLNNIDSLLFQFALQTRELSQRKNEINQQIKVCRVDIAERRSYIETIHKTIKTLEEEISAKQATIIHNKENAKSMKTTNSLLLQYEQTLKAELERRKASYNHDMEIFEERIASYKKTFQSHKEYFLQNPLAHSLLMLQAEKEEIECRIKACDDQIMIKQKELDHLSGPVVSSFSPEEGPDSVFDQQPTAQEKPLDHQTTEDGDSSIDISSLHLNQTKNGLKTSVKANAEEIHEENDVQDSSNYCTSAEKTNEELWSCQQLDGQSQPDEIQTVEQDQEEPSEEDQVLDQQSAVSDVEVVLEDEMQERAATDEEQAPSEETSSHETNPQPFPAKVTAVPSTPTFSFSFSPTSSPHQGTSGTKSPAFLFCLNSGPSTPGFSGFGFDVGSSQDEDSSFAFTGSLFSEKKTTESKSSSCPDFLFDQPEQSEDFQFAFASKSQSANKETSRDDFPFSFNF